jgi:hypothetical protein
MILKSLSYRVTAAKDRLRFRLPRQPRRIHAYGVGVGKTGTNSIHGPFARSFRSAHEPEAGDLVHMLESFDQGEINVEQKSKYLARRDRRLNLEIDGLTSMAAQRGAILVESSKIAAAGMSRISKNGKSNIGGKLVDVINRGNSPLHFQLDDNAGHAGTIASGLLANACFIEPVHAALGTSIEPFSDAEILVTAGLRDDR